jgi:hypothetical protein
MGPLRWRGYGQSPPKAGIAGVPCHLYLSPPALIKQGLSLDLADFIILGLAVYRLSLFADDPRLLKKLKKIHESFASAAFASLWFASIILLLEQYFHENLIYRLLVNGYALSGLACVLSQFRSNPRFIISMPDFSTPGDKPPGGWGE